MNSPRLESTEHGLTVEAAGRYLYSRYNPSSRPQKAALAVESAEQCLYFVPSPLLGYGLQTLLDRIPESSHILALEVSEELENLCREARSAELAGHPRVSWVQIKDTAGLNAFLEQLGLWKFRRIKRVDLSGGSALHAHLYRTLYNFTAPDTALLPHTAQPPGPFTSGPIVVAGAGPSLEKAFPFLRKNQQKLYILAADTAAAALWRAGIKADAIVVLETQAWNMLDFHGLSQSGIPVIGDLSAYPPSLNASGGAHQLFSSNFANLYFLNRARKAGLRPYILPPLGSVGIAAVEIALASTSGTVLLSGLDFAYTPGKTHAQGTSVHRWQLSRISRLTPAPLWPAAMAAVPSRVPAASGGSIQTDRVLESYAAIFKDRYAKESRLGILQPGGADLNLPLVRFEEAGKLLLKEKEPWQGIFPQKSSASADAQAFLSEELQTLERVIDRWQHYAEGRAEASDVAAALTERDEIYADFPDPPPLPREDNAFLVRAVSRSRRLQRYILRQLNPEA
ncbi:MAG: hypothetical protein CSA76_01105 [Spirochaetales bacterium]|nr:MAG: hypothetical protein CSA76_01105 [Spirochaetales bacterium]